MRDFSLSDGAVELVLVRHGEAIPEPGATIESATYRDLPLNARGRAQARALGQRLAKMKIATIFSSTLRRAAETAKAVSIATKRAISYDERLREVEIGSLDEPRRSADFAGHLDRLAELAITHGSWASIPGTESSEAIRARMCASIDAIVEGHGGQRIAVVSHAGAINAYLADVIGLSADFFFPAANASISILRARGEKRLLLGLNDVSHLHGLNELDARG